jgi:pimeloyl-ACP methyl ester carboxylesterase
VAQSGRRLTGYNTNENADDIESLRRALGAKKVSLWSISYGTTLALATIKRHGQNIDRSILGGVEGLDDALKLPSDVQQHLADIDRLVKADPTLNRQIPDFLGLMKTVLDRLDKQPITVEIIDSRTKQKVPVVVNKYAMQLLTASVIGSDSIVMLPKLYYGASKGDFSETASYFRLVAGYIGEGSVMSYMTDCSSGASSKRQKGIEREAKNTLLGNTANTEFPEVCTAWGNPDLGKEFRSPVKSNVPVLFISGTLDGRTPVSNAEAVRKDFPNSTHLIIEGAWHSDPLFLSSPQIKDVMLEFMRGVPISTTRIKLPPLKFAPLKS